MQIHKTELKDILYLAKHMRDSDKKECGLDTEEELEGMLKEAVLSPNSLTYTAYTAEGVPLSIFGVRAYIGADNVGVIWMLMTDSMLDFKRELVRLPPIYLPRFLRLYPFLINKIPKNERKIIKWLKHVGFKVEAPRKGEDSLVFSMGDKNV